MQAVIDAIVIAAAANALGCVLGCVPCCAIAAAMYLTAALLQLEKDAACAGLVEEGGACEFLESVFDVERAELCGLFS